MVIPQSYEIHLIVKKKLQAHVANKTCVHEKVDVEESVQTDLQEGNLRGRVGESNQAFETIEFCWCCVVMANTQFPDLVRSDHHGVQQRHCYEFVPLGCEFTGVRVDCVSA